MPSVPSTVEEWQETAVWGTKPLQVSVRRLYLLKGAIAVSHGIDFAKFALRQYVLDITHPDGTASSASLTIKSMTPSAERQRERDLDEIVGGYAAGNSTPQGLVGVYRTKNRTISVGYLLIPRVVEAVINNFSVKQLTDLRSSK